MNSNYFHSVGNHNNTTGSLLETLLMLALSDNNSELSPATSIFIVEK